MNFAVNPGNECAIHSDELRLVAMPLPVKGTVTPCIASETGVNPLSAPAESAWRGAL